LLRSESLPEERVVYDHSPDIQGGLLHSNKAVAD
jgi:hypothetical protein